MNHLPCTVPILLSSCRTFGVGRILICSTILTVECLRNFSYTPLSEQRMSHVPTGCRSTLPLHPVYGLRSSRLPTCRHGLRKMCFRRSSSTSQRNLPGMELPTPLKLCVIMICMCSASLPLVHVMFQSWTWTTGTFMYSLHRFLMRGYRNRRKSLCPLFSNWNQSKQISQACLRLWNQ